MGWGWAWGVGSTGQLAGSVVADWVVVRTLFTSFWMPNWLSVCLRGWTTTVFSVHAMYCVGLSIGAVSGLHPREQAADLVLQHYLPLCRTACVQCPCVARALCLGNSDPTQYSGATAAAAGPPAKALPAAPSAASRRQASRQQQQQMQAQHQTPARRAAEQQPTC